MKAENSEFYHIYNRGSDKRSVFDSESDFLKFYQYLYLFSDSKYENRHGDKMVNMAELASAKDLYMFRDPLVRVLAFNLLGNHFHFLLEQLIDNGIPRFLHKLQKTYSNGFNYNNERSGNLFESGYKIKHINKDAHYSHIVRYIHLNSLDIEMPEWRVGGVRDWDRAMQILNDDPWSSHHVYMGRPQQYPLVDNEFVSSLFDDKQDYIEYLKEWAMSDNIFSEERSYWESELE